eukprot:5991912-Pleurochrysis_carterae.AAC.5
MPVTAQNMRQPIGGCPELVPKRAATSEIRATASRWTLRLRAGSKATAIRATFEHAVLAFALRPLPAAHMQDFKTFH